MKTILNIGQISEDKITQQNNKLAKGNYNEKQNFYKTTDELWRERCEIIKYLLNRKCYESYTHVALYDPIGKFNIQDTRDEFMMNYCKYIYSLGLTHESYLYVEESVGKDASPVRLDVDIVAPKEVFEENKHLYTQDIILKILNSVVGLIIEMTDNKFFGEQPTEEEESKEESDDEEEEIVHEKPIKNYLPLCLTSVLFEKKAMRIKNDKCKDGFHIQFPFLYMSTSNLKLYFQPKLKERLKKEKLEQFGNGIVFDYDDTSNKVWLLYGGLKDPNSSTYRVTNTFVCKANFVIQRKLPVAVNHEVMNLENSKMKGPKTLTSIVKRFGLTNFRHKKIDFETPIQGVKNLAEFYYPYIFSTESLGRKTITLKSSYMQSLFKPSVNARKDTVYLSVGEIKNNLEMVKAFAEKKLINVEERMTDHNNWYAFGNLLYSLSNGSEEGLNLWIELSARAREHCRDSARCTVMWMGSSFHSSATIGSLYYYARIDNPVKYNEYMQQEQKNYFHSILNAVNTKEIESIFNDMECAKFIYRQFNGEWIFDPHSSKWYTFNRVRWEQEFKIRSRIYEFLKGRIEMCKEELVNYKNELNKKIFTQKPNVIEEMNLMNDDEGDDDEESMRDGNKKQLQETYSSAEDKVLSDKNKSISSLLAKIGRVTKLGTIEMACQSYFADQHFVDKLDNNPSLLGFDNGVLDLAKKTFRSSIPEDYISKSCNYNFPIEMTDSDDRVRQVDEFLDKLYPDIEIKEYIMNYFSRLLTGGNPKKEFMMLIGDADNGKTTIQRLLGAAFGDYATNLPSSVIVERTRGGNATPELDMIKGTRLVIIAEPKKGEQIDTALIKKFTGNDQIYARGLFKDGKFFEMLAKFLLAFNDMPVVHSADKAFWIRSRLIPHSSTFASEGVPEDPQEQIARKIFKRDDELTNKIGGQFKQAFMWMMYQEFLKNKYIPAPAEVLSMTENCKKDADHISEYILERTDPNKGAQVSVKTLYEGLYQWFKSKGYPQSSVPVSMQHLKDDIRRSGKFVLVSNNESIIDRALKSSAVQDLS